MKMGTEQGRIIGALAGIGAMVIDAESRSMEQFVHDINAARESFYRTFTPEATKAALAQLIREAVEAGGPNPLKN